MESHLTHNLTQHFFFNGILETVILILPLETILFQGTQHQYQLPGEYWVTLTVNAACGTSYDSSLITINPVPNVSFNADPVCQGQTTFFNNNSYIENASTRIDSCILLQD